MPDSRQAAGLLLSRVPGCDALEAQGHSFTQKRQEGRQAPAAETVTHDCRSEDAGVPGAPEG